MDEKSWHHRRRGVTAALHDNSTPHSDSLHVVERLRLLDGGKTLQNQITFEDPTILTKPWVMIALYERTDQKPLEDVCENTRLRRKIAAAFIH